MSKEAIATARKAYEEALSPLRRLTMTIDEAIEILQKLSQGRAILPRSAGVEAQKLGIEALKEVKWLRECQAWNAHEVLPGETEE